MNKTETILSILKHMIDKNDIVIKSMNELQTILEHVGLRQYYEEYRMLNNNPALEDDSLKNVDKDNVYIALDFIVNDLIKNNEQELKILLFLELTRLIDVPYVKDYLYNDLEQLVELKQYFGPEIYIEADNTKLTNLIKNHGNNTKLFFGYQKDNEFDIYEVYDSAISYYVNGHIDTCIKLCRTAIASLFFSGNDIDMFEKWLGETLRINDGSRISAKTDLKYTNDFLKDYLMDFYNLNNYDEEINKTKIFYMIYLIILDCCQAKKEAAKKIKIADDALFMLRLTRNILQWMY